ncbi:hypothetical protein AAC387_Pa07g0176 [Persea americana]
MGLKCGARFALATLLLVVLMMSVPTTARNVGGSGNLGFGFNYTNWAQRNNRIVVGGSQHWRFGFNYTNWAFQNSPFFQNDTLVFMYDPPNGTTFPHSVYLLKDFRSFMTCNLKKATMVGNVVQGGGTGFNFVLKERKPYYFACGERGGVHCNMGLMKFFVWPLKPPCKG